MRFNPFSGARRLSALLALVVAVGTLISLAVNDPTVSATYTIARPDGQFEKAEECPSSAGRHYFSRNTQSGKYVSVTLCLLTVEAGQDKLEYIPYKVDDKGVRWAALPPSTEVSEYKRRLERRFELPPDDAKQLDGEISKRYRDDWITGLGYLAAGLIGFAVFVWAVGWVVRGFMGVPQGSDYRPKETPQSDA
ncbi:MAG: hypothetical protein FJY42_05725 [Betaproteobacteria bacterium]|nr:hypothetical protein [Betaproteobacteria bacterium]